MWISSGGELLVQSGGGVKCGCGSWFSQVVGEVVLGGLVAGEALWGSFFYGVNALCWLGSSCSVEDLECGFAHAGGCTL